MGLIDSQVHQGGTDRAEPSLKIKGGSDSSLSNGREGRKTSPPSGSPESGGPEHETTDMALFVRTSSETLSDWNRQRIVDALLRETTIDLETAAKISPAVEEQIIA